MRPESASSWASAGFQDGSAPRGSAGSGRLLRQPAPGRTRCRRCVDRPIPLARWCSIRSSSSYRGRCNGNCVVLMQVNGRDKLVINNISLSTSPTRHSTWLDGRALKRISSSTRTLRENLVVKSSRSSSALRRPSLRPGPGLSLMDEQGVDRALMWPAGSISGYAGPKS